MIIEILKTVVWAAPFASALGYVAIMVYLFHCKQKTRDASIKLDAREALMEGSANFLWTVVANVSGGDWTKQSAEWQQAAKRARDEFHGRKKQHTFADRSLRDAVLIMEAINFLREQEAELVSICCDNPDPETAKDNCAIECVGLWTNWQEKRFYGITVQNALNDAVAEKRAFYEKLWK